jgi:hypothetical protein
MGNGTTYRNDLLSLRARLNLMIGPDNYKDRCVSADLPIMCSCCKHCHSKIMSVAKFNESTFQIEHLVGVE